MSKPSSSGLQRSIGARTLAINSINLTIGAGIFVLPANVAGYLGPASFIAFLGCGVLIGVIMLCFAEMGSRITSNGGAYAYIEQSFGPLAGFLSNTLLWFGWSVLADAAILNAMADMISIWLPEFQQFWVRALFFLIVLGLFAFVNIRGVKSSVRMVIVLTIVKLTPLILLIVVGTFFVNTENLAVKAFPSSESIGGAMLILFFAFMGTESALNLSGEMKNPSKSIPQGIFMGITGILVIYMLIQFVATGVLGGELVEYAEAPLAATAERIIGPVGSTIILVTAIISIYSTVGGDVLATSRLPFAASENNQLPKVFSRVHSKYHTPYTSILLFTSSIFIMAISGGFKTLAILASSSTLLIYLGVVIAVIKWRIRETRPKEGIFLMPGGYTIPIIGILTIVWLLTYTPLKEFFALSIFFAVSILFYYGFSFYKKRRSS